VRPDPPRRSGIIGELWQVGGHRLPQREVAHPQYWTGETPQR
jgi:hypothetical protein